MAGWKWTADLVIPFVLIPGAVVGMVGYCVWRERRFEKRMSELDDMFDVWEQIKREDYHALVEDDEVAWLEGIPHGTDWDIPDGWREAA